MKRENRLIYTAPVARKILFETEDILTLSEQGLGAALELDWASFDELQ